MHPIYIERRDPLPYGWRLKNSSPSFFIIYSLKTRRDELEKNSVSGAMSLREFFLILEKVQYFHIYNDEFDKDSEQSLIKITFENLSFDEREF